MKQLHVTALTIRDVLGAREFKIEPGRVTILRGRNASGKTSILRGLQESLGRGSLAKLARIGDEAEEVKPEVVWVLDGEGEHYRVKRDGEGLSVKKRVGNTAALKDVDRGLEFVSSLVDTAGASPVRFLQAADRDRVLMLLEAMPVKLDREALEESLGDALRHVPEFPEGLHPLQELALIRDAIYRARTGVNRDQKGKAETAEQTRRSIPAEMPEDLSGELVNLELEERSEVEKLSEARNMASSARGLAVASAEHTYETGVLALQAELERKKRALENTLQRAKDDAAEAYRAAEAALQGNLTRIHEIRERLSALRERERAAVKTRTLAEQAEKMDREAEGLKAESARLTEAIQAVDTYRQKLLDESPIPGLAIEDGQVVVDGIPFGQQNTEVRVRTAVRVAVLRAKEQRLPLVFVDNAEALDTEHFEALVDELKAQGVQAFIARVSDDELKVSTEG